MKKGLISIVIVGSILLGAGCSKDTKETTPKEKTKKVSQNKQQIKNTSDQSVESTTISKNSESTSTNIPTSSIQITSSTTQNSSNPQNNTLYTAKKLTKEQKVNINNKFYQWAIQRAKMGGLAVGEKWFHHGAAGLGSWYTNTVDGELELQGGEDNGEYSDWSPQATKGSNYPLHAVGGCIFFKDKNGHIGECNEYMMGGHVDSDPSADQHVYVLADNGKVYEYISKDGMLPRGQKTVGNSRGYENIISVVGVSNDKSAQEEYQRLLKEAQGR